MLKISAVIPTYNRKKYIGRAIDSVLAQSLAVDEIIVVDDGSTDGTVEAISTLYGSRVKVFRQAQSGVSVARRRCIEEARGEWIAFLDSDDEWTLDRTRLLWSAVERVPDDVAWVFGDLRIVKDSGESATLFEQHGLSVAGCPQVFSDSLSVQYPFQFCMLQGSLIRRDALLKLNCFSEGLQSSEDLLAGFQVACRYRFAAVPSVVGRYFQTSDLALTSANLAGLCSPDYYRARMLAFALVIESGRKNIWNQRYAAQVRGLFKALAQRGPVRRALAFEQFRFGGMSIKGLAFLAIGLLGRRGVLAWDALKNWRMTTSLRAWAQRS